MHCRHERLTRLGPAVAVLFALSVAAPRAGLFYHQHAGGDRLHVHADEDTALAELLDSYRHGHAHQHAHDHGGRSDHRRAGRPAPHGATAQRAALATDNGPSTGHWHQQQRFHRAVISAAPILVVVAPFVAAQAHTPRAPTQAHALERHARGPPHRPFS